MSKLSETDSKGRPWKETQRLADRLVRVDEDGNVHTEMLAQSPFMAERVARHARLIAYTEDRKSDPIIVDIIRELLER